MTRKLPLLQVGLFVALLALPLLFFGAAAAADTDIVLNELMASNTSTLADEDGDFSDWIELRNTGGAPVSLDSWYLTDDPLDLTKWQFPTLSLAADEYVVIFASGKNRLGAELHTNFSLKATGEYLALVAADGSTIISEFNPSFPAQQNDISYGVIQLGITGYLSTPTPGATNDTAIPFVEVSEPSQVFTSTLSVSLTALTIPGDTIRYTLDGSEPTGSSAVYSTPLNISNSTRLRARVFRDGTGGITNYGVYIKVAAEVANFDSDLPLVVVDTFNQSITTAYKQAFIAIIDTGNGPLVDRARIIDMPDYAGFAGIHRRGSSSGSFPKKQYKVELWDDANNSVDASLLGMPSESDWILYAPGRYERNMIANPLAHQLATDSDMIGFRTQFVELYLNDDDTNAVAANDYDGIYIWMENIKQGDDRVDVQDMEPGDNEEPEVTGGYIWSIDRQDASQLDFRLPSGYPGTEPGSSSSYINIVYPKEASLTTPQSDYFINHIIALESVTNSGTFSDPQSGYLKYIDMESWANGYLMDIFVKDPDLLRLSHFFYKPRYGKLYNDIAWDYDRTMESDDSRDNDPEGLINYTVCYEFWETFLTDPDFEQALVDQWFELRRTTMNTAYIYPLIDQQAAEIAEAYPREAARWHGTSGYGPRLTGGNGLDGTYAGEITHLKWWIDARLTWMDGMTWLHINPTAGTIDCSTTPSTNSYSPKSAFGFNPPLFSSAGGVVPLGSSVTITKAAESPASGVVYYTLDGSDPRPWGLGHNAGSHPPTGSAIAYSGPVTLNQSTLLRARTYDAATNTWSAITEVGFAMSTPANATNLIISEINYNAADDDAFEFIEFKNISNERIDLTGVQVSSAVNYTFDFTYLDAGEHLVIIKDKDAFNYRYTDPSSPYYYADIQIAGVWDSGSLDDSGETIVVTAADLSEIMSFKFDNNNGWPGRANGNGSSVELENPAGVPTLQPAKNDFLAAGNNWRPTSEYHGTPGRDGLGPDNRIVVNEVLAHTDPPLKDSIELFNTTAGTIDISGWFISDATGVYQKFEIPGSTSLAAGGFVAFDEDDFNNSGDPLKDFALNSAEGDEIYLLEADGDGNLLRFVDHVEFGPTKNGESIGRLPDGQGGLYRMCERTFGQSNSSNGNRVCYGPVVINEIHYNPAGSDTDREYIELYNFGDVTETFDNWQLRGEVDYDFAPGITLAPDTALLIVGFPVTDTVRLDGFRAAYNVDPAVTILGPWDDDARLDNGGSTIKLLRPDTLQEPPDAPAFYPMLIEDIVEYDDDPPWTIQPDGNGPSLELISPELDNRLATSWTASWDPSGTAGRHNDDDNPTISIEDILLYEEDSGLVNAVLDVTLSHRSGYTVTADFTTTAGSATAGSDFNAQSGQVEFAPGETDQTITILVNGDELYEGNESFDVTLSNAQNGQLAADPTATATILDDDPVPTVNIANTVSSAETDLSVTVTVTLSNPSAQTITVDYATADNNALNTLDYTAQNGTLTFNSGVTEQTFTITLLDDNIDESDETFWVNLSNVSNANLGEDQAVVTIMDDEAAPSLTIADGIIVEGNETGNSTTLAVTLSHPSSFAVTVDYATADDTATAGSDYVATAATLTFAPEQTSQTITVESIGDITDEVDERFAVNLSNASQATIADGTSVVTIIDDEGIPTVNVVDTAVVEGNDGTTQLIFDLLLLPASDQTVTVDYTTADDTATAGSDYVAATDTVIFAAGQTSQTVAITVNGDTLFEGDETMQLLLSNITGDALLSDGTAVGTITNDDAAPIVTLAADVSVLEGNSGSTTLTFTATLSTASVVTATMDYATADGSATAGSDYTAVSGSLTFAPGETSHTITVDILGDEAPEANETFTLSLSNLTAAQAGTTTVTITLIEDDAQLIYLPVIVRP